MGVLLLLTAVGASAWLVLRPRGEQATVSVAAAASLRPALEEIVAAYRAETGKTVAVQYGGSDELLARIRRPGSERGFDLYLPADDGYLADLSPHATYPLGRMRAVVLHQSSVVVASWSDLTAPGRRLALAEPTSAAIGKLTKSTLEASGRWPELAARIVVHTDTVTHSANAVKLGTVDAAIVWDAVAVGQFPDLPHVTLPELDGITAKVAAARLTDRNEVDDFWKFLTTDERCRSLFKKHGIAEWTR